MSTEYQDTPKRKSTPIFSSPFSPSSPSQDLKEDSPSYPTIQEYIDSAAEKQKYIQDNFTDEGLCDLVGGIKDEDFFVLMSEQGDNSKVYKLFDQLAVKVVKMDAETKNEVERYKELDPFNKEGPGLRNFPIIYKTVDCLACNPEKAGSVQCTMIVSELYDGSLSSIKKDFMKRENKLKIISMLIQVIFACSVLESKGLVHGDLHTGNILYKNIEENQTLVYTIDGEDFEINTYGKLWILWDFGNMVENGTTINLRGETLQAINTVQTDIRKLAELLGLRNRRGFGNIVKRIEENGKCRDLLIYLLAIYFRDLYKRENENL